MKGWGPRPDSSPGRHVRAGTQDSAKVARRAAGADVGRTLADVERELRAERDAFAERVEVLTARVDVLAAQLEAVLGGFEKALVALAVRLAMTASDHDLDELQACDPSLVSLSPAVLADLRLLVAEARKRAERAGLRPPRGR